MKLITVFSILALALAVNASEEAAPHGRRLTGGYSVSFCTRSLMDCCGSQTAADGVTEAMPYPNCRCPKRKRGGAETPYWIFGSYGSDDGICANCKERYPSLPVGNTEATDLGSN